MFTDDCDEEENVLQHEDKDGPQKPITSHS